MSAHYPMLRKEAEAAIREGHSFHAPHELLEILNELEESMRRANELETLNAEQRNDWKAGCAGLHKRVIALEEDKRLLTEARKLIAEGVQAS